MSELMSLQDMANGHLDVKALGEAANGDENTIVTTRTGKTYPSLSNALNQIDGQISDANDMLVESVTTLFANGGLPATPFATKALMTASALVDGKYAQVTEDTVNNGLYVKTAGAWVKSSYDPLAQAKTYTDNSLGYNTPNYDDILVVQDSNGQGVAKLDAFGKLRLMGLDTDVATGINNTKEITDNVFFDDSGGILKILDSAGNTTLEQTKDGDLKIAGLGSLKESLSQIGRVDNTRAHYSNQTNSLGVYQATKYEDLRLVEGIASFEQNTLLLSASIVNATGLLNFTANSVRTMGALRIGTYKYLIFFEAREAKTDSSRISSGSVVANIDPTTFQVTLGTYNILANAYPDDANPELLRTFMNGCGVKTDSGKIVYFCVRRLTNLAEHHLMMATSNDDGDSWTELVDISDMYKPQTGWNMLAPCTRGIVKRYGLNKGRLIFPTWSSGKAYASNEWLTGYIYSDDDGVTWHLGDFILLEKGNEVQVAEDVNGDLLFVVRQEVDKTVVNAKVKVLVRLEDGTSNYIRLLNEYRLTNETIMSSVIQADNIYDAANPKFIVSSCETTSRAGMLISTSYDGGYNWHAYKSEVLSKSPVTYTHIEGIDDTHYVVFYESAGQTTISSLVVSLNKLIGA